MGFPLSRFKVMAWEASEQVHTSMDTCVHQDESGLLTGLNVSLLLNEVLLAHIKASGCKWEVVISQLKKTNSNFTQM